MAKETESESLVRISNLKYSKAGKGRIVKNDPEIRITNNRMFFSASRNLDYAGLLSDGNHIEFEVKQTQELSLPLRNLRMSQVEQMEVLKSLNATVFMLVYFESINEWYRLEWKDLDRMLQSNWGSIPLAYFRAFGYSIPNHEGWPDYLSPETHSLSSVLSKSFPHWMPKVRKKKPIVLIESPDHSDMDAREKRIINAIGRGIKNAGRKQQRVEVFKHQAIMDKKYGLQK